jgi:hypothetical protein
MGCEEGLKEPSRHLSAEVYLDLSCRLETLAQDYCANTGCPEEEVLEALLSAAAHFAVHSRPAPDAARQPRALFTGIGASGEDSGSTLLARA